MFDFSIVFICHKQIPIMLKTIPNNIASLCSNTKESYEVILVLDGVDNIAYYNQIFEQAVGWGVDEIRLRWRNKNCATGDGSNNGHAQSFSGKSRFLITIEEDVAVFNNNPQIDILCWIRQIFEENPNLSLATRADDHNCWVWKLEDVDKPYANGVRCVNRVSSHFLIYDTTRCQKYLDKIGGIPLYNFYDNPENWFNYEDFLSVQFAKPKGPGIGYLDKSPIEVFHCDKKIHPYSPFYTKNTNLKLKMFSDLKKRSEGRKP